MMTRLACHPRMEGGLTLPAGWLGLFLGFKFLSFFATTAAAIEFFASFRFLMGHGFPLLAAVSWFEVKVFKFSCKKNDLSVLPNGSTGT